MQVRLTYGGALGGVHHWPEEVLDAEFEDDGSMVTAGDLIEGPVPVFGSFQVRIIFEEDAVSITGTLIFLLYIFVRLFAILLVSGEELVVGAKVWALSPIFSVPRIVYPSGIHLSQAVFFPQLLPVGFRVVLLGMGGLPELIKFLKIVD